MCEKIYLYGWNPFEKTGFSRAEGDIPLSYKILVSQNSENGIYSIKGEYKRGKKRLFEFLDFIFEQDLFEKEKLLPKIQSTRKFLNSKNRIEWIVLTKNQLNLNVEEKIIENRKLLENEIFNIDDVIERELIKLRKLRVEKREEEMWKILGIDYWNDKCEIMQTEQLVPKTIFEEKYGELDSTPAYAYYNTYRLTDGITIIKNEVNEIIKIITNNNLKNVKELNITYDIKNIEEIIRSTLVEIGYGFYLENNLKNFVKNINEVCNKLNYNIKITEDDMMSDDDEKIENRRRDYINTNIHDIIRLKRILNLKGYTIISIGNYEFDLPCFIIPIKKQEILEAFDENRRKYLKELFRKGSCHNE